MNRRQFLKGLLATLAATAIARNGVWQPEPERVVFDMGPAVAKLRSRIAGVGRDSPLVVDNLAIWVNGEWIGFGHELAPVSFAVSKSAYESSETLRNWLYGFHDACVDVYFVPLPEGE